MTELFNLTNRKYDVNQLQTHANSLFAQDFCKKSRVSFWQLIKSFEIESHKDWGREEYEEITETPFARPTYMLFLRSAWSEHC